MSEIEYRHLPERDEQFHRYLKYAFRPSAGPWSDEDAADLGERDLVERANRGLFLPDRDEPVTVAGWHEFRTRIRGEYHRVGGVSAVATPPEHRRRGHVRTMLGEMLAEFREEDVSFSVLWPFDRGFYRRLGWDTCSLYVRASAPPAQFRSAGADRAGTFHRVGAGDWETLAPVLATHDAGRDLYVDRTEAWWKHRALDWWDGTPYAYRWDDDEGEPRGYVVYRIDDEDDERRLRVGEMAWTDPGAYRQLLRFLGDHDSQVSSVGVTLPPDVTPALVDLVDDPSDLTVETHAGPMVRLVDVRSALERLAYPPETDEFVIGVTDPLVDDNEGSFRLLVTEGRATCEPTEADPGAVVSIRHLSQLAVGYRDATALAAAGHLDAPGDLRERLDAVFPAVPTFLRERF